MRRGILVAIACACLAGCWSSNPTAPLPPAHPAAAAGRSGVELPEPPVVHAVGGVAQVSLVADEDPATGQPEFDYDGMRGVVPTISVKPGEAIAVDLSNQLPNVPPPNAEGMADDVNLHFHGLGVSPKRPGDDVLRTLATPGGSVNYVVNVPREQLPGLYWYHPHVHGQTNFQVGDSGISGAIVIEGLERHLRGLAALKQRLIIVRATGIGDGDDLGPRKTNTNPCTTGDGLTVSLNGAVQPIVPIAPGERQFFRVVNATGHKTLKLAVDGESLELVAVDGFALDSYPGTPPTLKEASIVVPPAGRAEFVVTGPAGGHAQFRTLCYHSGPHGDPDPAMVLATLEAPRSLRPAAFAKPALTVDEPLPQNAYTTALPPPAVTRSVVLSENAKHFLINGKVFRMRAPPMFVVHVGTVEEWHIVNTTEEMHDFHIHQTHFLVESIDGLKVAQPHWADSVVVPHRRGSKPGEVVALMDFRDPVIRGEFVFHCHILDHEDLGMMAKIRAI
ncbi:MAG: multicopper oxidase family protein [Candidatus Tumulicola sp.]